MDFAIVSYNQTVQEGSFLLTTQTVDKILEATGMGPLKYIFKFFKGFLNKLYNKYILL